MFGPPAFDDAIHKRSVNCVDVFKGGQLNNYYQIDCLSSLIYSLLVTFWHGLIALAGSKFLSEKSCRISSQALTVEVIMDSSTLYMRLTHLQ